MRNMSLWRICLAAGLVLAAPGAQAQQVAARIAGLEQREDYMSLLREEARLQEREDSIAQAVADLRRRFREEPALRSSHTQRILDMEEAIFDLRNARGRLTDRIGAIEQEWVLANLGNPQPDARGDAPALIPEERKVRNLIYNPCFREQLPAPDYAALREAQEREAAAAACAERCLAHYNDLAVTAGLYAATPSEHEAAELLARFRTTQQALRATADTLARTWSDIYDDKTYAYAYLLDKLGQDAILEREEQLHARAAQELAALRDTCASEALADYCLRKRVAADYEVQLAELLRLDAARDSLREASMRLEAIDYRLPRVVVRERSFLDYAPIEYAAVSPYTYQNPIPECRIHPHGTIYRLLLGTFNTKRAAALFRGAHPLSYRIGERNKWQYFAGGFATLAEAERAQQEAQRRGFVRPEIVVWHDGEYRNVSRDPGAQASFRVEISGATALPEAVKQAINSAAAGYELSRIGEQLFVVGLFPDRQSAETAAAAIQETGPALEIKVAETKDFSE